MPPWRDLPVYLRGRLEAGVLLPDFTIVPGSKFDPEAYADEKELRKMDIIIKAHLAEGRPMFYKSLGNSMWPLVQSGEHQIEARLQTNPVLGQEKRTSDSGARPPCLASGDIRSMRRGRVRVCTSPGKASTSIRYRRCTLSRRQVDMLK